QWIDPASRQILLFAARRLAAERVVMILAAREEPGAPPAEPGLPVLRLGGLTVAECAELARSLGAEVSGPALRSLVGLTGGNPLAVLENLAGAAVGTSTFGPEHLELGQALDEAWGRVFEELPEDTRLSLFVVAVDAVSGGRHVAAALAALQLSLGSLAPAERRGLVRTVDGEIGLGHPLMHPVIVGRTPLGAKTAACRALAGAAHGHLRAWYLGAAATGPDDTAAEALAATAADARRRQGYGASARTWQRAAALTADHDARARRLLHAAADAHLAGDSAAAAAWCEEALALCRDPVFAAEAELVLGRARTWAGDPLRAFSGLVRASAGSRPVCPVRTVALLAEATLPAAMAGRFDLVRQVAQQADELCGSTQAEDAAPAVPAMVAEAFVMTGEFDKAERYRRRADALLPPAGLAPEQQAGAVFLAQGDIWTERYEQGRLRLSAVVDCGRRSGAPAALPLALGLSSELGWWTGRWASGYADATESLRWAQEMDQPGLAGYGLAQLSRIEAARGDREGCAAHVLRASQEAEPRGVGGVAVYTAAALGLCALSCGDLAAAIDHLERAWAEGQAGGLGNPNVVPFAGDLAEALARAGAAERAEEILAWLQARAEATRLVYPRAAAARARGILAQDPVEAAGWFARARAAHQRRPVPFEQARTLLCEGEALRRARRRVASRRPLRHALTLFSGLGARPWAARAMTELAAAGARAEIRDGATASGLGALSPQELQVARAVGRGLNNAEAAAALFVSRKTVESHLTRAYRKLGIRSRVELAQLLLTTPDG
ncbi:MAG TPA: helix-turn-helix transcriptional regulator, partial [Streptosporangiaceae bacterium]